MDDDNENPEELRIERERLSIEKEKLADERRFSTRYLGAIITASVTLAAVVVSATQVWVGYISKSKETAVSQRAIDLQRLQNEAQLTQASQEQDRRYKLDLGKFVIEHQEQIFSGTKEQQERIRDLLLVLFPPALTTPLFTRFERTVSDNARPIWQAGEEKGREQIYHRIRQITAEHLRIKEDKINPTSRFIEDLKADELAFIELIMGFEEDFSLEITDEDAKRLDTPSKVVDYIIGHKK